MRRSPQAVELLADDHDLRPRSLDQLTESMASVLARNPEAERALESVQSLRRRELLRVVMCDVLHRTDVEVVGTSLTDIADATVEATLELARREVPGAPPIAVVAMGRWGGSEMSYGSDADAVFVVADTDHPDATAAAARVVSRLRAMLRSSSMAASWLLTPSRCWGQPTATPMLTLSSISTPFSMIRPVSEWRTRSARSRAVRRE